MTPIVPIGLAAVAALLLASKGKASAAAAPPSTTYSTQTPSPSPVAQPRPEAAPAPKSTASMPEQLKQQMAVALGGLGINPLTGKPNGMADANAIRFATQLVGQLESQGYYDAARDLRAYVELAQKSVPTPAEAKPIADAAPPQLTPEQREQVARILAMDRTPAVLLSLINWLKTLPPSPERDSTIAMAQALRLQVLEAQSTAETLQKMEEVVKASNEEQLKKADVPPPPLPAPQPVITPQPPAPVPPPATNALPLPSTPIAVPATPIPQKLPEQKPPPDAVAAQTMVQHIKSLQSKYGVIGSKGRQNQTIVKDFQRYAGLTQDGKPGPQTLYIAASKGAVDLPLVMYWPTNATSATVTQYRNMLLKLADAVAQNGKPSEAAQLRASAAREKGQSGVGGAAAPATPAAAPAPALPAGIAEAVRMYAGEVYPKALAGYSTMRVGSRGSHVAMLQKALAMAGHPAGTPDGIFGQNTYNAVLGFQRKLGLTPDGVAGPNTLKMLSQNISLVAAAV